MITSTVRALMRLSLGGLFLCFGVWELVQPTYWSAFVPAFVSNVADPNLLTRIHGALLVIVGALIVSGFLPVLAAVAAILILLEIVLMLIVEIGFSDLIIRDTATLILSCALLADAIEHKK